MHHLFANIEDILEDKIFIRGNEVKHIRDVLRMKIGEELLISDGSYYDYICEIYNISKEEIICSIKSKEVSKAELTAEIVLYQALPKLDKMELIIQKAVELGASRVVPIITSRCVVKLDEKKSNSKIERWKEIAKSAAKQAKRNKIPLIDRPIKYTDALAIVKDYDIKLLAYENDRGIKHTKDLIESIATNQKIAIFIGPEGGFEDKEIELAKNSNIDIISLGNRILRTESAGFCILSLIMFHLEEINGQ